MASPAARTNDFSTGSVRAAILRMAVPITLAQLINILYNIVDRMYIGHIPGAGALALTGLGLCLPVISIVMAFARLSGMGGSPLCSIERGRGDLDAAEQIMGNSFTRFPRWRSDKWISFIPSHPSTLYYTDDHR